MAWNIDDKSNKSNSLIDENSSKSLGRSESGDLPLDSFPKENTEIKIPFALKPTELDLPGSDDPDFAARNTVSDAAKELNRTIHNLSLDSDEATVGGGLLADAAAQSRAAQAGSSEKRKKDKRDREHVAYLLLQQQLADLNNQIADLDREIDKHRKNMKIADSFISDLLAGKKPELDEDGSLKNKERERLIEAWEKRTGQTADRNDPNILLTAAREQKAWEEQQLQMDLDKRKGLEQRKAVVEGQLKGADAIQDYDRRIAAKTEALTNKDNAAVNKAITDLENQEKKNEATVAKGFTGEVVTEFELRDGNLLAREDKEFAVDSTMDFASAMSDDHVSTPTTSASKSIDGESFNDVAGIKPAFNAHAQGAQDDGIKFAKSVDVSLTPNRSA